VKRKRFSVEEIVGVLKQVEMDMPVAELIRQVGISCSTSAEMGQCETGS
jgi:putative transposase